ncbi:S8 family serine peptidase [Egicoccus sp. AB-alg2]|uniref:S8 family serine peptidase n=1 Tax=Egicoccus sp. AB-alg2 TaxID=3242693 RepID=UPI00359DEC4C
MTTVALVLATLVLAPALLVLAPPPLPSAPASALAPGDPYREQQWALDRIGADVAWAGGDRGEGTVVAIVDTGVALDHPDLRDRFVRDADGEVVGLDLVDGGAPDDAHGHGTLVAGIVAATADDGVGIAGVAPRASLLPIRVLDEAGSGAGGDVDRAIRWAVDHGADVVNLSLESVPGDEAAPAGPGAPTAAVRYAWERGVVVVVAAGNAGAPDTAYPADSPVVLVGAVDRDDRRADFSSQVREDALLAPGVEVISTWCRPPGAERCEPGTHTYGVAEGTSFAAPHVSGAIALLIAAGFTPEDAVARLRATAVDLGEPGPDVAHGHGRIDVGAAFADAVPSDAVSSDAVGSDGMAADGMAPTATGERAVPDGEAPERPAVATETAAPDAAAADRAVPTRQPAADGNGDVRVPPVVALPADDPARATGSHGDGSGVHLVAVACLAVTLWIWSAVARRHA